MSAAGLGRPLGLLLPHHKLQGGPPSCSCVREAPSVIHRTLSPKAMWWGSGGRGAGFGTCFPENPTCLFDCSEHWTLPPAMHPRPLSPAPGPLLLLIVGLGCPLQHFGFFLQSQEVFHAVGKVQAGVHLCGEGHRLTNACKTPPRRRRLWGCDLDTHGDLDPAVGLTLVITWSPQGACVVPLRPEVCNQGVGRGMASEAGGEDCPSFWRLLAICEVPWLMDASPCLCSVLAWLFLHMCPSPSLC